jgi:carnitine 3-dehydrogenase
MSNAAAIVGGGVIGAGWAARFLLNGWNVRLFDPHSEAERKIGEVLDNARHALPQLYDAPLPPAGSLMFCDTIAETVEGADWVQESVPERLDLKLNVYRDIQDHTLPGTLIGSSTSGFKPSELQQGTDRPQDILVAHPFNPVYLLPLVELVPSPQNTGEVVQRAKDLLTHIGMVPLHIRKEIDAHLADRMMESVWREALWLVRDDIATTQEIDDAIRYGFGLRWAQMGLFETYRVAGGEAGMKHFIAQFGPCLEWPWSRLTDVPELTETLIDKIAGQSDAQSGKASIRELERLRDGNLVGILRALKDRDSAAGSHINAHQVRLGSNILNNAEDAELLRLHEVQVLPSWIDYNGHMTEFRYLQVFGDASDALLRLIGLDQEYLETGHSYYTVESHIMHRAESKPTERLYAITQILSADDKRLHVFHTLYAATDDRVVATAEHMMLHVDSRSGKACPALPQIRGRLDPLANAHAKFPKPEAAGRFTGQRKSP